MIWFIVAWTAGIKKNKYAGDTPRHSEKQRDALPQAPHWTAGVRQLSQLTAGVISQLTFAANCLPAAGAEPAQGTRVASPDVDA